MKKWLVVFKKTSGGGGISILIITAKSVVQVDAQMLVADDVTIEVYEDIISVEEL